MSKYFKKYELLISILLIIVYIVANSFCLTKFSIYDYRSILVNIGLSILIILFIWKNKLFKYYRLDSFPNIKKYLYFIPLLLWVSVNLWMGININNTMGEIIIYIILMFFVGFLEEIIFRGFLFQAMAKDNIKSAIIVSSLTFGIGHIINLLNGELLVPTLIQIVCAISIGYLFSLIVYKSNSIWPCIITHSCINALSIFSIDNNIILYISSVFIIIVSIIYSWYINKYI